VKGGYIIVCMIEVFQDFQCTIILFDFSENLSHIEIFLIYVVPILAALVTFIVMHKLRFNLSEPEHGKDRFNDGVGSL
jgi:hypothetical protein